jgi:hypothetical protein
LCDRDRGNPRVYLGFEGFNGEFGFHLQEFELLAQFAVEA